MNQLLQHQPSRFYTGSTFFMMGLILLFLSACNDIPLEAEAVLKVTPGLDVTAGDPVRFDAESSSFDTIRWFKNDQPVSECNHDEKCTIAFLEPGVNRVRIEVKMDSKDVFGEPESKDTAEVIITVHPFQHDLVSDINFMPAITHLPTPTIAFRGVPVVIDARGSLYTSMVWKLDGGEIGPCRNQNVCSVTMNHTGHPRVTMTAINDHTKAEVVATIEFIVREPVHLQNFVDSNLRQCIVDKGIQDNEITSLDCSGRNIADLNGLQQFSRLSEVVFNDNQIADVSILGQMPTLRRVDIDNNLITDLNPLTSVISINRLSLNSNDITHISMLSAMPQLDYLSLFNNINLECSEIPPLEVQVPTLDVQSDCP